MTVFKCKMCGGDLAVNESMSVGTCEYCGSTMTLPKIDDDIRANLYARANHYRRNNEFDKAMSIYETILNEDRTDTEAYWSLVLCKYGIEYVEDPKTHKRVPTCNRTQFTSIFADEDYKQAIAYADGAAKYIYEAEAKSIDEIQKNILKISSKEAPYDVFICYKDTDNNGRRTPDSVLSQDIYYNLTQEGFKVFFARITLEDKLGTAYEPYIFAALNSCKVMVVVGTKPENFDAVWMKNEWSRYLALIKNGAKKTLIPAYKDMDPYEMPDEFSHIQAQDMAKLGFMQDLIRGIKKIIVADEQKTTDGTTTIVRDVVTSQPLLANLITRAFIFLEERNFDSAKDYFYRAMDQEPKSAEARWGMLLAQNKCSNDDQLIRSRIRLDNRKDYERILQYANESDRKKYIEVNQKIHSLIDDDILYHERIIDEDCNEHLRTPIEVEKRKMEVLINEREEIISGHNETDEEENLSNGSLSGSFDTSLGLLKQRLQAIQLRKIELKNELDGLGLLAIRRKGEIGALIANIDDTIKNIINNIEPREIRLEQINLQIDESQLVIDKMISNYRPIGLSIDSDHFFWNFTIYDDSPGAHFYSKEITDGALICTDPYIMVINDNIEENEGQITGQNDLVSSLNQILEEGRVPLILIANDYSKDWISVLGANGYQGKLRNIPIVIPSSVVNHSKIISDISKCTNAVVFSKNCDNGKLLKDFSIDDLGHIKKAILTNQKILFIDAY